MEIGMILVADAVILLYILYNIPIYLQLYYRRNESDDYMVITVHSLHHLFHYAMRIPALELAKSGTVWPVAEVAKDEDAVVDDPEREQVFVKRFIERYVLHPERLWHALQEIKDNFIVYRYFMNTLIAKLTCVHLYWRTRYGMEDAALVGIAHGVLWSIKGLILKRLKKKVLFSAKPVIDFVPVMGKSLLEIEFDCIFSLKLGNVITAIGMMFYTIAKEARDGGRTSDTRINEDSYGKYQRNG